MSPGRVLGEPLGPGRDIFSLGAILTYAVIGEPPVRYRIARCA